MIHIFKKRFCKRSYHLWTQRNLHFKCRRSNGVAFWRREEKTLWGYSDEQKFIQITHDLSDCNSKHGERFSNCSVLHSEFSWSCWIRKIQIHRSRGGTPSRSQPCLLISSFLKNSFAISEKFYFIFYEIIVNFWLFYDYSFFWNDCVKILTD